MKLYYTKGTCSFAPHIAMRELGIEPELIAVNLMEKKLSDGADYKAHNPKGYVPYVEMEDGTGLSECGVIIQYLADQHPEIVRELYRLFRNSKKAVLANRDEPDLRPIGFEAIASSLQQVVNLAVHQKLIREKLSVDELFANARNILGTDAD